MLIKVSHEDDPMVMGLKPGDKSYEIATEIVAGVGVGTTFLAKGNFLLMVSRNAPGISGFSANLVDLDNS